RLFFLQEDVRQDVQERPGSEETARRTDEVREDEGRDGYIDVEKFVRHGWRYLGLLPKEVYEMTHREFSILSEENVERTHDMREQEAMYAIIYAAADRGKG